MMRIFFCALLSFMVLPSEAFACRSPREPSELRNARADAIVLTKIKAVQKQPRADFPKWSPEWVATASVISLLSGKLDQKEIEFPEESPGSCERIGEPKVGKYYVLYLLKIKGRYYANALPYWAVKGIGDPRLAKLNKLFPLGAVRDPTPDETRLIDLANRRAQLPDGAYTRIYARASAGLVAVKYFRSRTPRRLMVDSAEEFPSQESCRCKLHYEVIDLYDLYKAGQLPPFNP